MALSHAGQSSLIHSLAKLLRNDGDTVLAGSSTLTLQASSLQQMSRLFEQHLLSRSQQHGFLAQSSHPGDTVSLLQLQFLFDMLQKTVSLKLISPTGERLQSVVKIFPFKSLKCLELKRIPPHCLEGLRGVYSQLEVFICSKSLTSLEELLSLCGGDLSSALPWLELHTLNFSYNYIVCLDQSLTLLNVLRSLDLSHNKIQECAEFLKPLSELEHLNLGYNCLQRAPTLSLSARFKLLTLILRYNELDTINGVEQLSSLQHLDLAYNVLVEHSQLAPLSMLHCLNTLNLDGNPLYFQKNHRKCTVRHLSPKAAYLRVKLDGVLLSSSELSVLPKRGQLISQAPSSPQAAPPVAERSNNQDVSSGAGELSDSMSVGEVGVTRIRKRKARSKVKVRRASISEPSDTDYEPRMRSTSCDIVLPHQKEIERMDSFREQLGEDWLRYRTHLEGPVSSVSPPPPPLPLANGHSSAQASPVPAGSHSPHAGSAQASPVPAGSLVEVLEVLLSAPLLSSEPRLETSDWDADQETESTLQWTDGQGHTESTLDTSVLDSLGTAQGQGRGPGGESPGPEMLPETQGHRTRLESGNAREEDEEEELGVDLCHPLLVGVLTEVDGGGGKLQSGSGSRREMFLRVKQGLLLEVDMQRGLERSRLELSSLVRVEPSQAAWTHAGEEKMLPVVHLQFDYISREKRGRSYVMLDDDPQQALQALVDVLRPLVEEKRQLPGRQLHLQCLRCRSEFMVQRKAFEEASGGRAQRRGSLGLPEGLSEELHSEAAGVMWDQQGHHGKESSTMMCPECGSDHVVQLDGQSLAPPATSTPIQRSSSGHQDARDDHDVHHIPYQDHSIDNPSSRDASLGCSPVLEATITTTTGDPSSSSSFVTAQGSSFFIGEGEGDTWADRGGRSCSKDGQGKEELSGSYKYTDISSTPPGCHGHQAAALHGGRVSPGDLDLLSEDYEGVDHRLKLFLDVEVFEEEEELHSFLKMSTVKFGEPGEVPSLLVMSNQRIYFLEMTSKSHGGQLSDWLQKRDSHPITDLSYLEVGLGSQSIHVEFEEGGVAYTLLVRDSARCKRYYSVLTGVVRELATKSDSKLKSISTTRLSPQHHLWPLVCEDAHTDMEEGQLQFFYLLSFLLQDDIWSPVTLLVTQETLYLLSEDHQWSKSLPSVLANEDGEPGTGGFIVLESQPISCISSVHLWSSDPCRMDIKLYDEIVKQEKVWCVRSEGGEMTRGLLDWVRARWEAMFGVKLTTSMQDTAT